MVDAPPVVTEATLKAVVIVSVFCFELRVVMMLTPPTVSVPFSTAAPSTWSSRVATTSRPWTSPEHVIAATESCVVELIDELALAAIKAVRSCPFT